MYDLWIVCIFLASFRGKLEVFGLATILDSYIMYIYIHIFDFSTCQTEVSFLAGAP